MKNRFLLPISASLLFALASCATMDSKSDGQTLSSSGFQVFAADTPQKQANLKKLHAYKVVPHTGASGAVRYVYADPRNNRVFVGDQFAYEQYQQALSRQEAAMHENMEAIDYDDSAIGWGDWGFGW